MYCLLYCLVYCLLYCVLYCLWCLFCFTYYCAYISVMSVRVLACACVLTCVYSSACTDVHAYAFSWVDVHAYALAHSHRALSTSLWTYTNVICVTTPTRFLLQYSQCDCWYQRRQSRYNTPCRLSSYSITMSPSRESLPAHRHSPSFTPFACSPFSMASPRSLFVGQTHLDVSLLSNRRRSFATQARPLAQHLSVGHAMVHLGLLIGFVCVAAMGTTRRLHIRKMRWRGRAEGRMSRVETKVGV